MNELDIWSGFEPIVTPLLEVEDDPALWRAVVNQVYAEAVALCELVPRRWLIVTHLGRCSHWLRPPGNPDRPSVGAATSSSSTGSVSKPAASGPAPRTDPCPGGSSGFTNERRACT